MKHTVMGMFYCWIFFTSGAFLIFTSANASTLYGVGGFQSVHQITGQPTQFDGSLVTIDPNTLGQPAGLPPGDTNYPYSSTPGGLTEVGSGPLYYSPPGASGPTENYLTGLDFDSQGNLYASTLDDEGFRQGASKLLRVDPVTGNQIGLSATGTTSTNIVDSNNNLINIVDLAFNPLNDVLYGVGDIGDLYTIDTTNAVATHVGQNPIGITSSELAGGLTFDANGNLYLASQGLGNGVNSRLMTIDPTDASILSVEDIVLSQQFLFGGQIITSALFDGLTVDENGVFYSSGSEVPQLFRRIMGEVTDKDGNVIPNSQGWVWEVYGDTGQTIGDLAFQPNVIATPIPAALPLMISGLLGLLGVARCKSH